MPSTKRPSARAKKKLRPSARAELARQNAKLVPDEEYSQNIAEAKRRRAAGREELLSRIVRRIRKTGKQYSIDIANACEVSYSSASSALKTLEERGKLVSWLERDHKPSGLGRRYYDLPGRAPKED